MRKGREQSPGRSSNSSGRRTRAFMRVRRVSRGRTVKSNLLVVVSAVLLSAWPQAGCRNTTSEEPPIHLNPNMDQQAYLEAQEASTVTLDGRAVFADGRAMRPPVAGAVGAPRDCVVPGTCAGARGAHDALRDDAHYYSGQRGEAFFEGLPARVPLEPRLLRRGEERFGVYCVPCHGATGNGTGVVVQRGFAPPPSYHDAQRRSYPLGRLFSIITKGGDKMPSFAAQIPVEDRWAIAAWVRTLQVSHNASLAEIPDEFARSRGWKP